MSVRYPEHQPDYAELNEAQTRFEKIDPALLEKGWNRADIRIEETLPPVDIVYGKGRRRAKGRTDYVLQRPLVEGGEPSPLAILEAKRASLPPEHGLQQGKGYRIGRLHHVPFVFSSNGHQFVEYDDATGATSEARPMAEFPTPQELVARQLARLNVPTDAKEFRLLTEPYKQGREYLRYYQDAAIRASGEKIARNAVAKVPPRVLLPIGTGAGKTRVAAVLLRKLFDAGLMGRGLFLCDRTELRDNGLNDFQNAFGNDAAEVDARHPQKNARVLIATYQTLDQETEGGGLAFFKKHYPPGYFDVIVVDECHRSAWGEWHFILEQNAQAIQIGLTATPRTIRLPKPRDEEIRKQVDEDARLLADNLKYFGEPVYEYPYEQGVADGYLAPAALETYDLFHDEQEQPERVRGVLRGDLADKNLANAITGQPLTPDDVAPLTQGASLEQRLFILKRVEAMCGHLFERLLKTGDGSPLQKTIIFCASDRHADLVTNELNRVYAKWCRAQGQKRVQTYAFKCMSSVNGQDLIAPFRTRTRSHFIATTKDLLSTGVNVPCVRNIVFFRYLRSPILFHQMIGRGTRIDAGTDKLMFRVFDYTGATALFGTDFVTPPLPPPGPVDPGPPGPPGPPPIRVKGVQIEIEDTGHFNLLTQDGRLTRVTPQQYQARLVEELCAAVPTLAEFRAKWVNPEARQELMEHLSESGLLPDALKEAAGMEAYDEFDVLAAFAYQITPMTRTERAAKFGDSGPEWLVRLPQPAANVIRAIVRQFEKAGTGALEATELWRTPDVKQSSGLKSLKQGGNPAELLRKTKETLFTA